MQETQSQFQIYSIGIAASNKHLDSDTLYVVPLEIAPFGDGELDSELEEFEGGGKDRLDQEYTVKVNSDRAVEADWLRITHTNRRTSPDVRRGERVMLYRHSDSGDLLWDSMGMDDHLRRRETVIYSWSATQEEGANATDPENCYSLEICTHTKQATFRTVKADEEPFAYTFQFNTGDGVVTLTDDVGNLIRLDSAATKITVINKDGTYTHWDKEDIKMYAPNDVDLTADNDIDITAGVDLNIEVGGDYNNQVKGDAEMEVGGDFNQEIKGKGKIDAKSGLDLTCGGSKINMTPSGMVIDSPDMDVGL